MSVLAFLAAVAAGVGLVGLIVGWPNRVEPLSCACAPRCIASAVRSEFSPGMDAYCDECTAYRCDITFDVHATDAELAKRYRETYGRDSWTPEQVERAIASAPVVRRQRRTK